MEKKNMSDASPRRRFLQTLATGTAAISMAGIVSPFQQLHAEGLNIFSMNTPPDEWFDKLNGKKHKMVFDVTAPHSILPFAWPKVFMITNAATGTPEKECGVVVVLRHDAIPYAMESSLWEKYHFGELFKADDPLTKKPSSRNPFWKPKPGDFKIPGVGNVEIGINELQDNGVMFCVCNMAMTVYSNVAAGQMNMQASDVMAEWKKGLLPGIEIMPSGVWALGRAQEKGCAYCSVS